MTKMMAMKKSNDKIVDYKGYKFWTDVEVKINERYSIRDYVAEYLKNRFANSRIIGQYWEFNDIDFYVIDEKTPIEIQTVRTDPRTGCPYLVQFERSCRDQIGENIKNMGKCWFFFNENLLLYLQREKCQNTSIQLDWFYKLMKEDKLKVFTVDCNGNIKERALEDFNFISKISVTCEIGKDNDKRILQKNKYDIFQKVLDYYNIIQNDLDEIGKEYKKYKTSGERFKNYAIGTKYFIVGNIFQSIGHLDDINEMFGGNFYKANHRIGVIIGIFDTDKIGTQNRIKFHNNSEVAEYFPMYLRNKEKWDNIKGKWLTARQLQGIIEGKVDYDWYKKVENNDNNHLNKMENKNCIKKGQTTIDDF